MGSVIDKVTWNESSIAGPAVTVVFGTPIVAWCGDRNSANISVANVSESTSGQLAGSTLRKTTLTDTSNFAPALATDGNNILLAWTGTNGSRTTNIATLGVDGNGQFNGAVLGRAFVNGTSISGNSSPSIGLSGGQSSTVHVDVVDQNGRISESQANAGQPLAFNPAFELNWIGATRGVAHPEQLDDPLSLVWAWTGSDGFLRFAQTGVDAQGTPPVVVSAQQSGFQPALKNTGGDELIVAWTGIDGAGRLNLAEVDTSALAAGRDPITRVTTLDEFSIAGPALIHRFDGGGNRPTILWTGTDGVGLLNAATVQLN
ncbi:hypothetical protein [Nocardia arthritidis]|uniref:Uncharacterized protein n=1 Tax=Nocardia arthritidis TaxID=228602 RepID=A0A6G9YDQ0_9NOCA|nr:hypothetical protein [Nocardia arthritidis]QIS11186.1 hypothetical protein F5544_16535 [Nocardia arthritidis]